MAGSRKNFTYTSDADDIYAVNKDESAAEATAGGITLFAPLTAASPGLPTGLTKRYVLATLSTNASVSRKFEIGRPEVFSALTSGSQIVEAAGGQTAGGTYNITSKTGEKIRLYALTDTGQTDGDQP